MENKQRNAILTVLFLGVLMGALDIAIVGPALPAIRTHFNLTDERGLTWVFSIYVLFNLVGTPLMAKLSDIYGRRKIYMLDVGLFALGSVMLAFSGQVGFWFLLAGRAVQGFGAGGIFPVASAVIGDTFPPEKRGGALGWIGAVFGLAFIIGPVMGGLLLGLGWQWLFVINLPFALMVLVMSYRLLPSVKAPGIRTFDWAGMALLAFGLAALAYGLNQIDVEHFGSSLLSLQVWPLLVIAVAFLVLFTWIERKAESPIVPLSLFSRAQLQRSYWLGLGAGMGEASLVFMPLLAVAAITGINQSQASYLLMPVVLALSVGSPLMGRLLDRLGSRWVIILGSLVFTLGVIFLSLEGGRLWAFITAGALIGFGLSALLGAPLRYIMLNEVNAQERSVAQGVITLFTSIGQLLGSALVGAVAASGAGSAQGYANGFLVIAAAGAGMIVVAFGLKTRSAERAMQTVEPIPGD